MIIKHFLSAIFPAICSEELYIKHNNNDSGFKVNQYKSNTWPNINTYPLLYIIQAYSLSTKITINKLIETNMF